MDQVLVYPFRLGELLCFHWLGLALVSEIKGQIGSWWMALSLGVNVLLEEVQR